MARRDIAHMDHFRFNPAVHKLRNGEYYWVDAPEYDPVLPMFIAKYDHAGKWWVGPREWFNHRYTIKVVRRVPRPKFRRTRMAFIGKPQEKQANG